MTVDVVRPRGWTPVGTHTGGLLPLAAAPLRPSCSYCWGAGKVHEMANGRMQWPPVPCEECFGTGYEWRTA